MSAGSNPLVVALDKSERADILALAKELKGQVGLVKVGLEAFVRHGTDLVQTLRGFGLSIFLDLKLHDIPRTVEAACRQLRALDVEWVTVHASGGQEMLQAAVQGSGGDFKILAVTVLTSLDQSDLKIIGVNRSLAEQVQSLANLAEQAGAFGMVCSGHELSGLKQSALKKVVPGIRMQSSAGNDDQKRIWTPQQAIKNGADWLVIGRPITQAPNPSEALGLFQQAVSEGVSAIV